LCRRPADLVHMCKTLHFNVRYLSPIILFGLVFVFKFDGTERS